MSDARVLSISRELAELREEHQAFRTEAQLYFEQRNQTSTQTASSYPVQAGPQDSQAQPYGRMSVSTHPGVQARLQPDSPRKSVSATAGALRQQSQQSEPGSPRRSRDPSVDGFEENEFLLCYVSV
jgi:hypothetical protein